jgi:hypothetical protein
MRSVMPITIWFLIVTAGSGNTSPQVPARFSDEAACNNVAAQVEKKSADKFGMPHLRTICVSAPANKVM